MIMQTHCLLDSIVTVAHFSWKPWLHLLVLQVTYASQAQAQAQA